MRSAAASSVCDDNRQPVNSRTAARCSPNNPNNPHTPHVAAPSLLLYHDGRHSSRCRLCYRQQLSTLLRQQHASSAAAVSPHITSSTPYFLLPSHTQCRHHDLAMHSYTRGPLASDAPHNAAKARQGPRASLLLSNACQPHLSPSASHLLPLTRCCTSLPDPSSASLPPSPTPLAIVRRVERQTSNTERAHCAPYATAETHLPLHGS